MAYDSSAEYSPLFNRALRENAMEVLKQAKRKEKKHIEKGDLVRVEIFHGHVMTNHPERWEEYNKINKNMEVLVCE